MATVSDYITDALEITGIKSPYDTLETVWGTVGLRRINSILDGWNIDNIMGFTVKEIDFTPVTLKSVYTIGSAGDIVASPRPVRIERAFITTSDSNRYEVRVVGFNEWKEVITDLDISSDPLYLWYDAAHPTGNINLYPEPPRSFTLELMCFYGFAPYSATSDTISLPQGYSKLLTYQLAIELCSHIAKPVPPDVRLTYANVKRDVEAVNFSAWMPETKIISNTTNAVNTVFSTFISRGI